MKKVKIEWLTKSSSMFDHVNGVRGAQLKGGRYYEISAINALKSDYDVNLNREFIKHESIFRYLLKDHERYINGDICVLDPYIISMGKFSKKKRNVAIIHHIDEDPSDRSLLRKLFNWRLIRNLRDVDKVIVVSEYWKKYLLRRSIDDIEVIYNSFPVENYEFTAAQISDFKTRFNFPSDRPVIYAGQYGSGKGVEEVLSVIDSNKYHLIVTGKRKYPSSHVVTHYFQDDEYPLFLASCDVVICMSTMAEGWNRTAHEAILSRTPVIGSGSGGMEELLRFTDQTILNEVGSLNTELDRCLQKEKRELEDARRVLLKYDTSYFESKWKSVIAALL